MTLTLLGFPNEEIIAAKSPNIEYYRGEIAPGIWLYVSRPRSQDELRMHISYHPDLPSAFSEERVLATKGGLTDMIQVKALTYYWLATHKGNK